MIKKAVLAAVMICFILFPQMAYAEEMTVEEAVELYQINEADSELREIRRKNGLDDFSLKDTVMEMLSGDYSFSFSELAEKVIQLIAGEAADVIYIMKKIVIIVLLAAMLETLSSSFASEGVSKLGQYICTAVIIVTVMQSF